MSSDLLIELLQTLDAPQPRYAELDRYASGTNKLAYLSPEAKIALPRLNRIVSNIPGLAVTSLAERLRIVGYTGVDVWADYLANDLDQTSTILHREALIFGDAYVICWSRPDGSPLVTVESPQQVAVIKNPATREIESAVKRWTTKTDTHAMVYLPDRVEHWRANTVAATATALVLVEVIDHDLQVVPVVNFSNSDRILGSGHSEIDDLAPLVDGLNATLAGLAVAQEYTARPRRWATGIELMENPRLNQDGSPVRDFNGEPILDIVPPIREDWRTMWSERPEARFGTLAGADLNGYSNAVDIWLGQIMAVSALPAHFVGITTQNPSSAEALRASESSITARAEQRQKVFGRSWEQVARLMVAIRTGVDPTGIDCRAKWADASTRSIASEADATVKLYTAGLLSRAGALRRLGMSDDEIDAELAAKSAEIQTEEPIGVFYGKQANPN